MLTTREAAALIGCHPRHVALLCRRGVLPCARFGRDYAIRREDAEAYQRAEKNKGGRPRRRPGPTVDNPPNTAPGTPR